MQQSARHLLVIGAFIVAFGAGDGDVTITQVLPPPTLVKDQTLIATDKPAAVFSPPSLTISSPPPFVVSSPPPPSFPPSPPPPPGAGSDKTAVLSVITMTGTTVQPYNSTLGTQFMAAVAQLLGVSSSSVVIRSWGTFSRRRLLSDSVSVTSAALFSNGVSAAAGLNTLQAADASGALQSAFEAQGLQIDSATLSQAETALPSNFEPLSGVPHAFKLSTSAIALIIAACAVVLIVLLASCCCRRYICCCCPASDEEEDRLPNMIKFGTQKQSRAMPYFYNTQAFSTTPGLVGQSLCASAVKGEVM